MVTRSEVDAPTALLDAVEALLAEEGYAAVSTRTVAARAGVNHGLVHYYFGSVDNLMLAALQRFTDELHERQRALYAAEGPFLEKWRTAMALLVDGDRTYAKLWLELQAMSWNRPEARARLSRINTGWREVLTDALTRAAEEYAVDTDRFPVEALVALVMTFNQGVQLEQAGGITQGHRALLDLLDRMLQDLHDQSVNGERER